MTYKEKIIALADKIQYDTGIKVYIEERPKTSEDYIVLEYYGNKEIYADNRVYHYDQMFTLTYGTKDRYSILDVDTYIYDNYGATKDFTFDKDSERYDSIYTIRVNL